jgi:hypothetical protein
VIPAPVTCSVVTTLVPPVITMRAAAARPFRGVV